MKNLSEVKKGKINQGIYGIYCEQSNKWYVGQAIDINKRIYEHRRDLRKGEHHSYHLQAAYNKYGEDSFKFVELELVENGEDLTAQENWWMQEKKSLDGNFGYNLYPAFGSLKDTERLKSIWNEHYNEALQLKEYPKDRKQKLHNWCDAQRQLLKKGELLKSREELLEKISWWWWDAIDRHVKILEKLTTAPKKTKNKESSEYNSYKKLKHWRREGKLNKSNILKIESRVSWMDWKFRERTELSFMDAIKIISNLKDMPNCNIEINNWKVGHWALDHRIKYDKGLLPNWKIIELEKIPWWSWETDVKRKFDNRIKRWQKMSQAPDINSKDYALAIYYRKSIRNKTLEKDKQDLLENIDWFNKLGKRKYNIEEIYNSIQKFFLTNGFYPNRNSGLCGELEIKWSGVNAILYRNYNSNLTKEIKKTLSNYRQLNC